MQFTCPDISVVRITKASINLRRIELGLHFETVQKNESLPYAEELDVLDSAKKGRKWGPVVAENQTIGCNIDEGQC